MIKYVILTIAIIGFAGCVKRTIQIEPDTEWILAQYHNKDPKIVDAQRIKEGW